MTAKLLHYRDGKFESIYELGSGRCEVGRDKHCDITIDNPTMSRHHFALAVEEDGTIKLSDLDAENGTYVNGVREYVATLEGKTTIQAGSEMFLLVVGPEENEQMSGAESSDEDDGTLDGTEPNPPAMTSSVAPVLLRRMQAEMRIRVHPHLVLKEEGQSERVFALGPGVTPIGFGNLKISLGPAKKMTPTVVAELVAQPGGSFQIRAKALFSRVRINGKDRAKARLEPGDEILISSRLLVFHPGLDWSS